MLKTDGTHTYKHQSMQVTDMLSDIAAVCDGSSVAVHAQVSIALAWAHIGDLEKARLAYNRADQLPSDTWIHKIMDGVKRVIEHA